MAQLSTENISAYFRKIAIDGYVIKLDKPELHELTMTMKRISNNENQIAKRLNETWHIYETDIEEFKKEPGRNLRGHPKNSGVTRKASVMKSSNGAQPILQKSFRGLGLSPTSFCEMWRSWISQRGTVALSQSKTNRAAKKGCSVADFVVV